MVVHGTAAIFDGSGGTIGQVGAGESYGELGLREKVRARAAPLLVAGAKKRH